MGGDPDCVFNSDCVFKRARAGNQQDGFACLFGSCNMWGWYGLALGIGLFPCLVMIPFIFMMRSSWKRRLAEVMTLPNTSAPCKLRTCRLGRFGAHVMALPNKPRSLHS